VAGLYEDARGALNGKAPKRGAMRKELEEGSYEGRGRGETVSREEVESGYKRRDRAGEEGEADDSLACP
jgi:hypothetical protein